MTFAGLKLRTAVLLSPLLFATACTTQSAMTDGMSVQTQTSFASTPVETSEPAETTVGLAAAAPSGDGEVAEQALPQGEAIPVPAFAEASEAQGQSGGRLVQVASLDPSAPLMAEPAVQAEPDPVAERARPVRASSREHECLARAMYFESNRSSREGMVAVGSVVMNRVQDGRWGNSVCSVVGAPRQFAPGVMSRRMDSRGSDMALEAAASVLEGERHPKIYDEVMFFHTAGYRFKYNNMHYVAVAGGNSFYEKRRRMRGVRNTPQHVVMAQGGGSRVDRLVAPVKTAFTSPVKTARSLFGAQEDETPQRSRSGQDEPMEVVETPQTVAVRQAPVSQANAGYVATPSNGFLTVPGKKGSRVLKTRPAGSNH